MSTKTDHVLILNPPRRMKAWTPWACICGAGGTGGDEDGATAQYELHVMGLWPCAIEPTPRYTEAHVVTLNGRERTIWAAP